MRQQGTPPHPPIFAFPVQLRLTLGALPPIKVSSVYSGDEGLASHKELLLGPRPAAATPSLCCCCCCCRCRCCVVYVAAAVASSIFLVLLLLILLLLVYPRRAADAVVGFVSLDSLRGESLVPRQVRSTKNFISHLSVCSAVPSFASSSGGGGGASAPIPLSWSVAVKPSPDTQLITCDTIEFHVPRCYRAEPLRRCWLGSGHEG